MRSEQEIINALKLIKDVCEESKECVKCPIRDKDNGCSLGFFPNDWVLLSPENNDPRMVITEIKDY